jgi:hypothetical protein
MMIGGQAQPAARVTSESVRGGEAVARGRMRRRPLLGNLGEFQISRSLLRRARRLRDKLGNIGNSGRGVAESFFTGTRAGRGKTEAIGAEVMEIVDGKIKEIRDYHQPVPAKAA